METSTWTSPLLPKTLLSSLLSSPLFMSGRPAATAASAQSTDWAWEKGTTSTTVKPRRPWLWWVTSRPCWIRRASSTPTRRYRTTWDDSKRLTAAEKEVRLCKVNLWPDFHPFKKSIIRLWTIHSHALHLNCWCLIKSVLSKGLFTLIAFFWGKVFSRK